jgi:MFS family permease
VQAAPLSKLGLRENWRQFVLLVVVNVFVGTMVGAERVVLPLLAEQDIGIASNAAMFSFLVTFGVAKALANLGTGMWSDRVGRKPILVLGWIAGLPVPLLLYLAPSWNWVVFANLLLGVNQGCAWSTTVIMKIDLVGPRRRGLAMGLNEAAGYLAVSGAAFLAGIVAVSVGYRGALLAVGLASAVIGLALSALFVRETRHLTSLERGRGEPAAMNFSEVFAQMSWRNRSLFCVSQAGMVNNLNDGMAWGLLPLFYAGRGLSLVETAFLGSLYPAVWGLVQLGSGALSDTIGRKKLIASGMFLQGAAFLLIPGVSGVVGWALLAVVLGVGTAAVYPTLLAAIGDQAHPNWRASAVGVYRLWRDGGYAVGALLAGASADALGLNWAIWIVGGLTAASGLIVAGWMKETARS